MSCAKVVRKSVCLNTPSILPGKRRCPSKAEIDALIDDFLKIPVPPQEIGVLQQRWTLAFPDAVPEYCARDQALETCRQAKAHLLDGLRSHGTASSRKPLVFASMGCTGSGKSRMVDEIGNLLFPGEDTVVLKVTYNSTGIVRSDRTPPAEALMWRVIASAVSFAVNKFYSIAQVPRFVAYAFARYQITEGATFAYLNATLPLALLWVLGLDEVVKATGNRAQIFSFCSAFARLSVASQDAPLRCVFVTSLDWGTIADQSLSGRHPYFLPQYLWTEDNLFRSRSNMRVSKS